MCATLPASAGVSRTKDLLDLQTAKPMGARAGDPLQGCSNVSGYDQRGINPTTLLFLEVRSHPQPPGFGRHSPAHPRLLKQKRPEPPPAAGLGKVPVLIAGTAPYFIITIIIF